MIVHFTSHQTQFYFINKACMPARLAGMTEVHKGMAQLQRACHLRAVGNSLLENGIQGILGALGLLQLCCPPPDGLLAREH